jgi:hypothetical protein
MASTEDDRSRAAMTDGERHRQELAANRARVLRLLETEREEADPAEPAEQPRKRTILYRGTAIEVDIDNPLTSVTEQRPITYRGVTEGGADESKGRRRSRRKGEDVESRLRRLKALHDDDLLTDAEYEAKKAEVIADL